MGALQVLRPRPPFRPSLVRFKDDATPAVRPELRAIVDAIYAESAEGVFSVREAAAINRAFVDLVHSSRAAKGAGTVRALCDP